MKKSLLMLAGIAAAAVGVAQGVAPQVLYKTGQKTTDQGMHLRPWGSGTISQTDEISYEGAYSLQVSTRNFFQGGIVAFDTPQDVSSRFEDKNNLLKVALKVADGSASRSGGVSGGGKPGLSPNGSGGGKGIGGFGGRGGGVGPGGVGPGGFPGGGAGAPGQGNRGGGFPGAGGGQGFPGGPGGGAGFPGAGGGQGFPGGPGGGQFPGAGPGGMRGGGAAAPETLKNIRLTITTTDGKRSEIYVPINTNTSTDHGWKVVAVPLQAINGFDKTNKQIKDISFSGDATSTFFLGDIRVINDSTPIQGEILNDRNINLALGDTLNFHATGAAGSSILKYSWDFGANDTLSEDAVGQNVARKFRKPGSYKITLTISDMYGLKTPVTSSINVKVNP